MLNRSQPRERLVKVRLGDVNTAAGLKSHQPAIAGALGTLKLLKVVAVRLVDRKGPYPAGNLVLAFEVL